MYKAIAVLSLGALALWPAPAAAQDWRTITSRRQQAGEDRLRVEVEFGAGELRVEPAAAGALYHTSIRYDASIFRPVTTYRGGSLKLGLEGGGGVKPRIREGGRLELGLGPGVPLDLDLAFGAVEADLELGGLKIRRAEISTGASETRLRFSQPNPERLDDLTIAVGAAAFRATGLANANAERVKVDGGVGEIVLDFTGEWRRDLTVDIDMGLGSLTLRIPRGVGVRVVKDTFLMSFDSQGLIKRGNAYYSEDWDEAKYRLNIAVDGALGSIDVRWLAVSG